MLVFFCVFAFIINFFWFFFVAFFILIFFAVFHCCDLQSEAPRLVEELSLEKRDLERVISQQREEAARYKKDFDDIGVELAATLKRATEVRPLKHSNICGFGRLGPSWTTLDARSRLRGVERMRCGGGERRRTRMSFREKRRSDDSLDISLRRMSRTGRCVDATTLWRRAWLKLRCARRRCRVRSWS